MDKWSATERKVARKAFDSAFQKECSQILSDVKKMAMDASKPPDLWDIRRYLDERLKEVERKYDYRYGVLPYLFARLLNEGWISLEDIAGLGEDKIEHIRTMAGINSP